MHIGHQVQAESIEWPIGHLLLLYIFIRVLFAQLMRYCDCEIFDITKRLFAIAYLLIFFKLWLVWPLTRTSRGEMVGARSKCPENGSVNPKFKGTSMALPSSIEHRSSFPDGTKNSTVRKSMHEV